MVAPITVPQGFLDRRPVSRYRVIASGKLTAIDLLKRARQKSARTNSHRREFAGRSVNL